MDVPAEPADHHRRVLPRHHQDFHRAPSRERAQMPIAACRADTHSRGRGVIGERRVERAEQAVGAVPAVGQALCVLAAARRQRAGDLAGGVRVQMRAVAGVVGGGVLADHERPVAGHREQRLAQDLVGDVSRGGSARPASRSAPSALSTVVSAVSTTSVLSCTRSATLLAGPHLPVLAGTPRAGRQFDGIADEAVGDGVGQRADAHAGLRQRAQHPLQPHRALVPPVAEQFGVERGDHVGGPPDALGLATSSRLRTTSTKSATWLSTARSARSGS